MVVKVALNAADYETLNHRAGLCRHRIETYLEEVLAVTAADLRRCPRCTLTRDQCWTRKPDPAELLGADPEPVSGWGLGRSVAELDKLHERAMRCRGGGKSLTRAT